MILQTEQNNEMSVCVYIRSVRTIADQTRSEWLKRGSEERIEQNKTEQKVKLASTTREQELQHTTKNNKNNNN